MRIATILPLLLILASPARAIAPEAERKVMAGLSAGYGLDFKAAAAAFAEADLAAPDHPVGPFFLGSLKWLEFSLNSDLPGTAKNMEPEFDRLMDRTFDRASAMLKTDKKNAEAHFYMGAAYGMRGRWKMTKRQWIRAASDGWKGYKHLKEAVTLDPNFYDAYLGLGMYDYYSDKLPGVLKLASSLLIVRGDKERGLKYVKLSVDKGHYSVMEAKLFLIGIYMAYEKQPQRALEILKEMRLEMPDNLFLLYMEVAARTHAQDWFAATAFAEDLVAKANQHEFARPHIPLFEVYLADAYLGAKDFGRARAIADRCVEMASDPRRAAVTYCRLRRAQASDLMGNREAAVKDYAWVAKRPDYWDSEVKARRGLKSPADYERILAELLE